MKEKPVYRLRELIIDKYGKQKFEQGCMFVAQWIRFADVVRITPQHIVNFCALQSETNVRLNNQQKEALRQLFGLISTADLYTTVQVCDATADAPTTNTPDNTFSCTSNFVI